MMGFKVSPFLLGVLLWVLCTHSKSFASILISTPNTPQSLETTGASLNDAETYTFLTTFRKDINSSIAFAEGAIKRMNRLETTLGWSGIHVEQNSPAHGQLINNAVDIEGLAQVRPALIAVKAAQQLMNKHCKSVYGLATDPTKCVKYLVQLKMDRTPLEQYCKTTKKICSPDEYYSKYRSVDGSCNHVGNETWGKSFTGYRRLIPPNYFDGVAEPRRSINKRSLPSARLVSVKLVNNIDKTDEKFTLALMQWGQFISHDLGHTASSRMIFSTDTVMCCDEDGSALAPRYIHPFCYHINVPEDDKFYSQYRVSCMSYVRSLPAMNSECLFGPMNQMNQVTHYLDASHIYGSSAMKTKHLREFKGGRLVISNNEGRDFLPFTSHPKEECQVMSPKSGCYIGGDVRINMQPHLTTMHILWLREHNRIAEQLHKINPEWDDEKLFQETKRLIIAEIQHITYNEWVPLILGEKYSKKVFLNDFNEDVDPRVSNSFATAAMKFTNSLVDSFLKIFDEERNSTKVLRLHEHYNKPTAVDKPGNLDGLIRGLATQSCQKLDLDVVSDMTEKLYSNGKIGFDALSLDIQRGRDHGLPGYTDFRDFCGLSPVNKFNDLQDFIPKEVIQKFQSVYYSPKDIDLVVGGLAERPLGDSLLGPTFTCIITEQLSRTRTGDRYFYSNMNKPWSFTPEQLNEIKKVTLASVFCNNGDDIKTMQLSVFQRLSDSNELTKCEEIPQMDLDKWKEQTR